MFKLWSETSSKIKNELKPNLWLRWWNSLDENDKYKIWKFMEKYFFNFEQREHNYSKNTDEYLFYWHVHYKDQLKYRIESCIYLLNEKYKSKSFASDYLRNNTLNNACSDFYAIFSEHDENIVLELLSIYSKILIKWSKDTNSYLAQLDDESNDTYNTRFNDYQYLYFDEFSNRLNEVFSDFWINLVLTRLWFIPKQEQKIVDNIFKPTLELLSDKKWDKVSRDLSDWFSDYSRKDYSWCITKSISAIQWFIQIQVDWKLSNLSINDWIKKSKKMWLIPDDIFTETIFKNLESIISRERQETADAHPKRAYANEQNARLILNLSMVFMQHFNQKIN